MKLIGSYTSPYVRKISVMLLEKGIPFDFINDVPHEPGCKITQFNPLGKVPALVTDDGECWYDSPIIAQYLEQLGIAPDMLPAAPKAALKLRQIEALADGVMEAAQTLVREKTRPAAQQSESELLRQREKIARGLDALEGYANDGTLRPEEVNLATISTACAIAYLNFRRVAPGWCATRPKLVRLVDSLFQRASFARTEPPVS